MRDAKTQLNDKRYYADFRIGALAMVASFLVPAGDTEAEIRQEAAAAGAVGISSSRLDQPRAPPPPPISVCRASPLTAPKAATRVAMATVDRGGEEVKGRRITGPIR